MIPLPTEVHRHFFMLFCPTCVVNGCRVLRPDLDGYTEDGQFSYERWRQWYLQLFRMKLQGTTIRGFDFSEDPFGRRLAA